ncbi:hypothetical protein AeRB84_012794 [Aphanomyces euteiches]|nr:hypothetical protein AeRB84_012794 [Aphanomyces euteiches]
MQVDRRGTVLWQWIHDALTAQGYTSDSTLGLDSLHGMFSPMEYAVPATNTRLLVRAILIGNKFMLHCERHDGMTTTWRVDFPLKAYIPADPALYPKHREYVVWRVQKDIVDHGTASIQANLVAMPDHARNLALSFLDAKSLVQVRGACQILAKSSMEPSLWQQHLQREFPQLVHDIGGANAFPAYVNAFQ